MIIFELDNVLADTKHRKHFIDPHENPDLCFEFDEVDSHGIGINNRGNWRWATNGELWKCDYDAYNAACIDDKCIQATSQLIMWLSNHGSFQIWTTRCESVRDLTLEWLENYFFIVAPKRVWNRVLKMRPVGDGTPTEDLKKRWAQEHNSIEIVFASDPFEIYMWRNRGVFVFDCNQER